MKVEFLHAAEEDLAEAAAYYDLRVSGLGREFLLEVERVAAVVLELSALGEQLDPVHRRVPLRRFPYGWYFGVRETSSVSSQWHITGAEHATGLFEFKIASDDHERSNVATAAAMDRMHRACGMRDRSALEQGFAHC